MALVRIEGLKAEMQSRGVRFANAAGQGGRIRQGGAGPAEGVTLFLDGRPASVPVCSEFANESPYSLEQTGDHWSLLRRGERIPLPVALPREPPFYRKSTPGGVPYRKIALLHGADCLASTVLQTCCHWGTGSACRFCGVGLSWKAGRTERRKDPGLLAEVAKEAKKDGAKHVTLTAGTTRDRQREWLLFMETARAVSESAGLPVHVQVMPPISVRRMERLRENGVATIGIHLESFDSAVLKEVAPCKASLPMEEYLKAWEGAVRVFGRNQVSSFLLMGLGESPESLVRGCENLASMGVYPYLVPFRPIPGTPLSHRKPIRPEVAMEIYREAARVLEANALHWSAVRAGCVRCRGCSALPEYQDALSAEEERLQAPVLEVIREGPLLDASYEVRHEVFVEEQAMFHETDRDEMDARSLHIVALTGGACIGTVRITPLRNGDWLGSRLAVRSPFRGRVGSLLVKKAEEEVRRRGGRRFSAYIQASRVEFFERCAWRCVREIPDFHGRPHVLMLAAGPAWQQDPFGRPSRDGAPGTEEKGRFADVGSA